MRRSEIPRSAITLFTLVDGKFNQPLPLKEINSKYLDNETALMCLAAQVKFGSMTREIKLRTSGDDMIYVERVTKKLFPQLSDIEKYILLLSCGFIHHVVSSLSYMHYYKLIRENPQGFDDVEVLQAVNMALPAFGYVVYRKDQIRECFKRILEKIRAGVQELPRQEHFVQLIADQ